MSNKLLGKFGGGLRQEHRRYSERDGHQKFRVVDTPFPDRRLRRLNDLETCLRARCTPTVQLKEGNRSINGPKIMLQVMQQTEAEYGGYDPEEEQHADGAHRIQMTPGVEKIPEPKIWPRLSITHDKRVT